MSPKSRGVYLAEVRRHATELLKLLRETKFDRNPLGELSEENLARPLSSFLGSWGEDESSEGHVVAFHVDEDGASTMFYDYPDGALSNTLSDLIDWTHWDDYWGGGIISSAPIAQANAKSLPTIFFTCTLFEKLAYYGLEIPFPILATVANVALELGKDEQTDEESVRKQVRRYQARNPKQTVARTPFEGDWGF